MANSHPKGGPAAFRPSELLKQNTKARLKRRDSLIPKRHKVFTPRQILQRRRIPAGLLSQRACHASFLLFPHHIPLLCHSPSTVRERLCCDGSAREQLWHCEHSEQSPTLSSPNTRPSFLGREDPSRRLCRPRRTATTRDSSG